jgi:hypothetical protein
MRVEPMSQLLQLRWMPLAVLAAACASQEAAVEGSGQQVLEARNMLSADVRACSAQLGFDPATATGLGERELAPQELQWRQCAYDAGRRYIDRNPAMRSLMEQLIAEDSQMTGAIQQGTLTRSERRARVEELLGQLRAAEQKELSAISAQQERKAEEMNTVYEGIRGLAY